MNYHYCVLFTWQSQCSVLHFVHISRNCTYERYIQRTTLNVKGLYSAVPFFSCEGILLEHFKQLLQRTIDPKVVYIAFVSLYECPDSTQNTYRAALTRSPLSPLLCLYIPKLRGLISTVAGLLWCPFPAMASCRRVET